MSVQALTWVFANSQSTLGARLVLLSLANFAHDDGTKAFPTVSTLAEHAKLSERQVQYALRELEQMGEISCTGKTRGGVNIYALGGAKSAPDFLSSQFNDGSGATHCTPPVQPIAPPGAKSAPLTQTFCTDCELRFSSKRKFDEHRYNVHHDGWAA